LSARLGCHSVRFRGLDHGAYYLAVVADHAAEGDYGMPAFNLNNVERALAILAAAHSAEAPVIVWAAPQVLEVGDERNDDIVQSGFWKAQRTIMTGPAPAGGSGLAVQFFPIREPRR
jgi:Fructose-bisphosphate aldolase class-II